LLFYYAYVIIFKFWGFRGVRLVEQSLPQHSFRRIIEPNPKGVNSMDHMDDPCFGPTIPYGLVSAREAEGLKSRMSQNRGSLKQRAVWVLLWLVVTLYGYSLARPATQADSIPGELMIFFGLLFALGSILIWVEESRLAKKHQKRRAERWHDLVREATGRRYF
jgi:hypothetical protein